MSEIKQPAPNLEPKKSAKTSERVRRTITIELKLFEPTADDYPEFSVPELLYKERQKAKKAAQKVQNTIPETPDISTFAHPFNHDSDDDEDVQRLTKKMNEKYGTGSGYEINDKAIGYDESDSFIDNTEAFDEMIVDDTPRGGFYINSGPLVFKKQEKTGISGGKKRVSMDTEDEGKAKHKKKKNKKDVEAEKEKGKTMAIKDVLRLQRDNALKKQNRIVSDDEESEDSGSSAESSEDSDVKFVESTTTPASQSLPPGLPDSVLVLIGEFKAAIDKKEEDKYPDLRARVDASSLPPETKAKVHSYLQSLIPPKSVPEVSREPGLDLPMLD